MTCEGGRRREERSTEMEVNGGRREKERME
jgi:hypothetical protein